MAVRIPSMAKWLARAVAMVACAGFVLPAVPGELRLQTSAAKPIAYVNGPSFQGCAAAKGPDDPVALRMAVLQARAVLSRSRSLTVGGVEKLVAGDGGLHLVGQVREVSEGFQAPVSIVEKSYVKDDGALQLCVLIVENSVS
ncbi:hypothetical protein [Duganella vulcania]|uniref:Uncharacterized protein n=1 Tax=Duganella vulcania TaxID=2692166 RepID=A0A845GJ24_9BURK|nr:hypothetical protein [Duganella vulcania]MYM92747.1 hypothetical protein [Duganella vulcania]